MSFCLLCGARVEPTARFPFRWAGISVSYCPPCDRSYSDDKKLLAVVRALDDRKATQAVSA